MSIVQVPEVVGSKCTRRRSWLFIMPHNEETPIFGWYLEYDDDIYKRLTWYIDRYTDETCNFTVRGKSISRDKVAKIDNLRTKTGTLFTIEWEGEFYDVDIVDIDALLVDDATKLKTHGHWLAKWRDEWVPANKRFIRYPNYVDVTPKTYLKAVLFGVLMGTIGAVTMIYIGIAALSSGKDN